MIIIIVRRRCEESHKKFRVINNIIHRRPSVNTTGIKNKISGKYFTIQSYLALKIVFDYTFICEWAKK